MKAGRKRSVFAAIALAGALMAPLSSPVAAQSDPEDDIVPDFCLIDIETPWFDIKVLCLAKKKSS